MKSQASDPLPQRVRELMNSVESTLASLPDDPSARAASVAKIQADLDRVKLEIQKAPNPTASSLLVQTVLRVAGGIALREILDTLIRSFAPARRCPNRPVVWV